MRAAEITAPAVPTEIGREAVDRYLAAIKAGPSGPQASVPPLFSLVAGWSALVDLFAEQLLSVTGGGTPIVHLTQDTRVARPLRVGDRVVADAQLEEVTHDRGGTTARAALRVTDAEDGLEIATHRLTAYLPGCALGSPGRRREERPPAPSGDPTLALTTVVDDEQPRRYAAASGDWNPVHLDVDAATAAGFDGPIAHGLCVLAMVGSHAVDAFFDGDHGRITGLAGRFSRPVRPGTPIELRFWRQPERPQEIAFRCSGPDGLAIKHGLVIGGTR